MKEEREFPVMKTKRLLLWLPTVEAAPRMLAFVKENQEHFAPWSPPDPPGYYTEAYWRERLALARTEFRRGQSMRLVFFERQRPEGPVVGDCNFTNIVRGAFQSCYLGYKIDRQRVGQGLMSEALAAAITYAFDDLGLHRIMANYVPVNERSGRLLRRLGFVVEGYARDYLFIAGEWRDHVLTSLTNPGINLKR
ncbi:MAG: GNAT family N-acetyltransferase [Pyrinomonadaceae bacterium]